MANQDKSIKHTKHSYNYTSTCRETKESLTIDQGFGLIFVLAQEYLAHITHINHTRSPINTKHNKYKKIKDRV